MNNIFELPIEEFCCGCRTCEYVCPTQFITVMHSTKDGFIYPSINDSSNCISCGLCVRSCPIKNKITGNNIIQSIGMVNHCELSKKSASGGVFAAVAEFVLENNGIVYGCTFNKEMQAVTERICDSHDLVKLLSSKYVQCNTNESYEKVKKDLLNLKEVLFCSTPCQVAGLIKYLGRKYDNLITIDLFCHGVPSPGLFQKYIQYLEEKYRNKVTEIVFRDKKITWGTAGYIKAGKMYPFLGNEDPYYYSFLKTKTYQKICYNCPYAKEQRIGDLSIGDYWGIESEHPEVNIDEGVSAVLINTEKGRDVLSHLSNVTLFPTEFEKIRKHNSVISKPTPYCGDRDVIYEAYQYENIDTLFNKYLKLPYSRTQLIKRKIINVLNRCGLGMIFKYYMSIKHGGNKK